MAQSGFGDVGERFWHQRAYWLLKPEMMPWISLRRAVPGREFGAAVVLVAIERKSLTRVQPGFVPVHISVGLRL